MPFNSLAFVVFFLAVLVVHSLPLPPMVRKFNLLVASYLFYATWDARYVTLLVFSTAVNGVAAALFSRWDARPTARRVVLWTSVLLNLGLLAAFKYGNELLALSQAASAVLSLPSAPPKMTILLPIGLSFFTLQAMSYTIDVYRRTIKPLAIFDLALFISFFPVLLAGPILRAGEFVPQSARPRRASGPELAWGISLFTLGIFMKVTLADHLLAPAVEHLFSPGVHPDTLSAWAGTMGFAAQDYCDFGGYSICAQGLSLCLGIAVPANFRAPFAAIGFRDLWQRWHITLVAWLRDYLFNPLGGVYKGASRAAINVMIIMLVIGLWHGAALTFVVFGFLHGTFLISEMCLQRTRVRRWELWRTAAGQILLWAITVVLCLFAFVFYRANTFEQSWWIVSAMVGATEHLAQYRLPDEDLIIPLLIFQGLVLAHWLSRNATLERIVERVPSWVVSLVLAVMLVSMVISTSDQTGYLYFRF